MTVDDTSSLAMDSVTTLVAGQRPGWTLEGDFYTNRDMFRLESNQIFRRSWLYAGHASRIPKRGDFFLYETASESIILIRGDQGLVHALHNVCRHRGSRVCTASSGRSEKLVCPYHQWVYDIDGSLLKARLAPEGFDRSSFGLKRVSVCCLEGLIFICLDANPPDFASFAKRVGPQLRPQHLEAASVVHSRRYELRANWKLVVENSRECYHCGAGHPQYCRAVAFAAGIDSPRVAEEDRMRTLEHIRRLASIGIEARPVPFVKDSWFHCRRFFLRPGFESESMDGQPVAPRMAELPGSELGALAVVAYPNFLLEANSDYAMAMRFTPLTEVATRVDMEWLIDADAAKSEAVDVERLESFWRLTAEQDWRLCEENQRGVETMGYEPGPYAPDEKGVEQFVGWYLRQIEKVAA